MRTALLGLLTLSLTLLSFGGSAAATDVQGPYSVDILVEGQPQPVFVANGQAYVAGVFGAAYEIRVHNRSGRRVEAVVAVDGRDVVTGQPVQPLRHRGHLVPAWGTASIAGFRSSSSSVATFRFSTIPRSYAWQTGTSWGIGTVRVWIFDEAVPEPIVELPHPMVPHGAPGARSGAPRSRHAAPSADGAAASAPRDMGTEYGEQRWSPVMRTHFQRQGPRASAVLGIRYQSHDALAAAGILHRVQHHAVIYDEPYYCHGCEWPHPHPHTYEHPRQYAPPPPMYRH